MLLCIYAFMALWLACSDIIGIVFDNDDSEVDVAGTADVSRFQAELDLGRILVTRHQTETPL
jgi:hypothetical protein